MNSIEKQLKDIGIHQNMSLEVHSSYKNIKTDLPPEDIIKSLQKIVTINGNIVMPTFPLSKKIELNDNDRKLGIISKSKWLPEDHNKRTDMGIIPDIFRLSENVFTGSGQHRMSAWGKNSKEIIKDLNNLINDNGYALLIGVDIRKLTAMHYVEYCIPNNIWPLLFSPLNPGIPKLYNSEEYFVMMDKVPKYHKGWLHVQSIAEKRRLLRHGKIGYADCMLFKIKEVISIYENEIKHNINELFDIEYYPTIASS